MAPVRAEGEGRMKHRQRHLGRVLALLWLFQIDVGSTPPDEAMTEIPDELEWIQEEGVQFARDLVGGTIEQRRRIDDAIVKYAMGWPLTRMAAIDRNVLRVSLYEILFMPDVPASVSVDEAVEIAKEYSTEESGRFVNGILGAFIRGEYDQPERA